jgi:hypothetical protein
MVRAFWYPGLAGVLNWRDVPSQPICQPRMVEVILIQHEGDGTCRWRALEGSLISSTCEQATYDHGVVYESGRPVQWWGVGHPPKSGCAWIEGNTPAARRNVQVRMEGFGEGVSSVVPWVLTNRAGPILRVRVAGQHFGSPRLTARTPPGAGYCLPEPRQHPVLGFD